MAVTGRGGFPYRMSRGGRSSLRRRTFAGATAVPPSILANFFFGPIPTLTATAQSARSRVLLTLAWPHVTTAQIVRVDPDGTQVPVRTERGDDTASVCATWVGYDHEAPLDATVTYLATSTEADGSAASAAVTVASGGAAWLKHLGRPSLNTPVRLREIGSRGRQARRGVHQVIGRAAPIVLTDVRASTQAAIVIQTPEAATGLANLETLLADGSVLLLQFPSIWGGESAYVSVGDMQADPLHSMIGDLLTRHVKITYDVVDRPAGMAVGAVGETWDDAAATYATYDALAAAKATYDDLTTAVG